MTIVHVYDELQASGLVERKKGAGPVSAPINGGSFQKGSRIGGNI